MLSGWCSYLSALSAASLAPLSVCGLHFAGRIASSQATGWSL